jgi:hypothetical protein
VYLRFNGGQQAATQGQAAQGDVNDIVVTQSSDLTTNTFTTTITDRSVSFQFQVDFSGTLADFLRRRNLANSQIPRSFFSVGVPAFSSQCSPRVTNCSSQISSITFTSDRFPTRIIFDLNEGDDSLNARGIVRQPIPNWTTRLEVSAGNGNDTVLAGGGDDNLDGGAGVNDLRGGDGKDRLSDAGGGSLMDGEADCDFINNFPDSDCKARFLRLYNPNANFHFFTTSQQEFDALRIRGYRDESTNRSGFQVFTSDLLTSLGINTVGLSPIFRLYNVQKGYHYYTHNQAERDYLVGLGWRYEKDEGLIFARLPTQSQIASLGNERATEVFRLYNRNSGAHLFTADQSTRLAVLALPGWEQHTSLGFAFAVSAGSGANSPARRGSAMSPAAVAERLSGGVESTTTLNPSAASQFPAAADSDALLSQLGQPVSTLATARTAASSITQDARVTHNQPPPAASNAAVADDVWQTIGGELLPVAIEKLFAD